MRSTLFLALSLATTLALVAPCGSEAAAQRSGRVHRQTRAHAGNHYRVYVDLGRGGRGYGRYDDYDRYDGYDRYDDYDRYDRYDRYDYDRYNRSRLEARYRGRRANLGFVYRQPRYRYRYRRAGVLDVLVAVARAAEADARYRDGRGRRGRHYRYHNDL